MNAQWRGDRFDACEFQAEWQSLPPRLLVTIDTEEEFDWEAPFSRSARSVQNIAEQQLAQQIFDDIGAVPTYVIDQAIVECPNAVAYFKSLQDAGKCTVGAHLHPWLTPPFDEAVNNRNSYPGNLPEALEAAKLATLTRTIAENFQQSPTVYKAGRYGLGPCTGAALQALGYRVDLSVVPHTDYSEKDGPDFIGFPDKPFWLDCGNQVLAVPLTCGYAGLLWPVGDVVYPPIANAIGKRFRLPGLCARLGCLERVQLTPEGTKPEELTKLTDALFQRGHRVFQLAYHSSSLLPGGGPYVADRQSRAYFLDNIKIYLDYFLNILGGEMATPGQLYDEARRGVGVQAGAIENGHASGAR